MKKVLTIALAASLAMNGFLLFRIPPSVFTGRPPLVESIAPVGINDSKIDVQAPILPQRDARSFTLAIANAEDSSSGVIELVGQRKRIYQAHPEWRLPEFAHFSDEDWLNMAKDYPDDTDEEARASFGSMRQLAKQDSMNKILDAIATFQEQNSGAPPKSLVQLSSYISDEVVVNNLALYKYVVLADNPARVQIIDERIADTSVDFGVEAMSGGGIRVYRIGTLDPILRLCENAIIRNPSISSSEEIIRLSGGDLGDQYLRYSVDRMLKKEGRTRR